MTRSTNDSAATRELSIDELDAVAGGKWSWGDFAKSLLGGGVTGGMGGAAVGGIGAVPGAIGGGLLGGIGYCISQLF
ncbi:Blp family class II bacteriocin [Bradyrhizobium sp. UFLA03-84]|uniref:Blp family class II bacteriocin n=1 Tax=Bradyrhizobium sp. UFLA03-84 TaxID=418599 RepID=UPI00117810BB|nr:Blp family class II bacteriocin [Bradyrhizobium sp. UFLA03-84]